MQTLSDFVDRFPRVLNAVALLLFLAGVFLLCATKITDFDFWWHVKAGDVMRAAGDIIRTDPFAYTREGQPYLANHEWLSQVIFSLVWGMGGATGVIILRSVLVAITFGLLLSIDLRRAWINVSVALAVCALLLGGFADRPQLFTYALFAASLVLCLRLLDLPADAHKRKMHILAALFGVQVVWVNMHGAACILGLILYTGVFLQRLVDRIQKREIAHRSGRLELGMLIAGGLVLGAALLVSPSGLGNITYLLSLMNDQTVTLIREWVPTVWFTYLLTMGPLLLAAIVSVLWTRSVPVFALFTLAVLIFLSRQAVRHEMPLAFAAAGILFYQLRAHPRWTSLTEKLLEKKWPAIVAFIALLTAAGLWGWIKYDRFTRPAETAGYGTFEPAKGAYDFLEREKVKGNMFNYDWGGYYEFRGYPDRKVFFDARNVEFGYAFMRSAVDASQDPDKWREIEDRHGLTSALIYYHPYTDIDPFPYVGHLSQNSSWALAYVDDWMAVYLKDTPDQRAALERTRYRVLTPELLEFGDLDVVEEEALPLLEREIVRSLAESPDSMKPKLLLGRLYALAGMHDDAEQVLRDAAAKHPGQYRPWELLGALFVSQEQWVDAANAYERMLDLARGRAQDIDRAALQEVFDRAGR